MSSHHLESVENLNRTNTVVTPPKDSEATEVRASEKAKGGLKYELVLAEPSGVTPPPQLTSPQKPINVSLDEINKKMREAEERRLSMEAKKLSKISTQFERIQEAHSHRRQSHEKFKEAALESLQTKMGSNKENREKYLNAIKERARDHERHVEEVRQKVLATPESNDTFNSSG